VLGKVTVNCMDQNPQSTIFGSTILPLKQWKSSDPSITLLQHAVKECQAPNKHCTNCG